MAFCMKCGAPLPENAAVCPQCGAPAMSSTQPGPQPGYQPGQQPGAQQNYQQYAPQPVKTDFTNDFSPELRYKLRWMLALGYISPLFLIFPMLVYHNPRLVRFHLNQSLCLLMLMLASSLIMIIPFVGWFVGAVGCGFWLVLTVIDIVRVVKQQAKWTPLVGKYVVMPVDD